MCYLKISSNHFKFCMQMSKSMKKFFKLQNLKKKDQKMFKLKFLGQKMRDFEGLVLAGLSLLPYRMVGSPSLPTWVIASALISHSAQLSPSARLGLLVSAQSLRPLGVSARSGASLVVNYSLSNVEWELIKVLSVSRNLEFLIWDSWLSTLVGLSFGAQLFL